MQTGLLTQVLGARHAAVTDMASDFMLLIELNEFLDEMEDSEAPRLDGEKISDINENLSELKDMSDVIMNIMEKIAKTVEANPPHVEVFLEEEERKLCFDSVEKVFNDFDNTIKIIDDAVSKFDIELQLAKILDKVKK